MKTVDRFFPELSAEEVQQLLDDLDFWSTSQQFEEEMKSLIGRLSFDDPQINLFDSEDFTSYFDYEPIPFFASTWTLCALKLSEIRQTINARGYHYAEKPIITNFAKHLLSDLQQLLLRAQLDFVSRHFSSGLPGKQERSYEELAVLLAESSKEFAEEFEVAVYVASQLGRSQLLYLDEVLSNLNRDRDRLSVWGICETDGIRDLRFGLGDTHSGRSVVLIEFDSGVKVLYKPRSLQAEVGCGVFAEKISSLLGWKTLITCPVIDCGEYGWAWHIENEPDTRFSNPQAIAEFASFLKLLAFSDVHFENVHFQDGVPVLIDAETVLTAGLKPRASTADPVHQSISRLVTSTGLFPSPLVVAKKNSETFFDVGVLGRRDGSTVRERQLVIKEAYTNRMRVEYEDVGREFNGSPGSDQLNECFVREVSSMYAELMGQALTQIENLEEIIHESFRWTHTRVVLQDTIRYSNALHLSGNHQCLSTASNFLAALSRSMLQRPDLPAPVRKFEIKALSSKDIPRYSVRCDQRGLKGNGEILLQGYYELSPIGECIKYLTSICPEDLQLESWLIQVSFAPYLSEESNMTGFEFGTEFSAENGERIIEKTLRNGIRQLELGHFELHPGSPGTWVGARLSQHQYQYWYVDELSLDLYAGSIGVALPLLVAGTQSGIDIDHYWEKLHRLLFELSDDDLVSLDPGAISGCHSALWVLHNYYALKQDAGGLEQLRELSIRMLRHRPQDLDFTSGLAGLVVLAKRLGVLEETDLLENFLEQLRLEKEEPCNDPVVTGYAHGISGYIAALSEVSPELGYRARIEETLDFLVRRLFNCGVGMDVRWPIDSQTPRQGRGWCSGTPGILLALTQLRYSSYEVALNLDELIKLLIADVKANTFGGNPTLCHGDIGNLWILEHVAMLTGDQDLLDETKVAGRKWLTEHFARYLTSLSRSAVSHGLFVGIGGACLYALHLLDPNQNVRSPLWLG